MVLDELLSGLLKASSAEAQPLPATELYSELVEAPNYDPEAAKAALRMMQPTEELPQEQSIEPSSSPVVEPKTSASIAPKNTFSPASTDWQSTLNKLTQSTEIIPKSVDSSSRQKQLSDAMLASRDIARIGNAVNIANMAIAQGMGKTASTAIGDAIKEQGKAPVEITERLRKGELEDIALKASYIKDAEEDEKRNPASKASKATIDLLKASFSRMGKTPPVALDGLSLRDVEQIPQLKTYLENEMQMYRADMLAKAQEARERAADARLDQRQKLSEVKDNNKFIDTARNDLVKYSKNLNTAELSLRQLKQAIESPSGIKDTAAVMKFISSIDNTAAREGEVKALLQSTGQWNVWKAKMSEFTANPRKVNDKALKEMLQIAQLAVDEYKNKAKDVSDMYISSAKARGVPETRFKEFIPSSIESTAKPASESPSTVSASEVERKDPKTGKIAIFDAQSKQFLRWKE